MAASEPNETIPTFPSALYDVPSAAPAIPVGNLAIRHLTLDAEQPYHDVALVGCEYALYALTGYIEVYVDTWFQGTIGGRRTMQEFLAHVVRFPAGTDRTLRLLLHGHAADCLLISCEALPNRATKLPYWQWNDHHTHVVGEGTHQRTVLVVPTPPSFRLSLGETYNAPGTISAWPPQATQEDLQAYADKLTTWDEQCFIVCDRPGHALMHGYLPGVMPVSETVALDHGAIVRMPLGLHAVHAAVDSYLKYVWAYCGNALQTPPPGKRIP
jgi:5-deoxy-D-glucuronate isomerase